MLADSVPFVIKIEPNDQHIEFNNDKDLLISKLQDELAQERDLNKKYTNEITFLIVKIDLHKEEEKKLLETIEEYKAEINLLRTNLNSLPITDFTNTNELINNELTFGVNSNQNDLNQQSISQGFGMTIETIDVDDSIDQLLETNDDMMSETFDNTINFKTGRKRKIQKLSNQQIEETELRLSHKSKFIIEFIDTNIWKSMQNVNGMLVKFTMTNLQSNEWNRIGNFLKELLLYKYKIVTGINKSRKSRNGVSFYLRCSGKSCKLLRIFINISTKECKIFAKQFCEHVNLSDEPNAENEITIYREETLANITSIKNEELQTLFS